jgi:hypothetical protein
MTVETRSQPEDARVHDLERLVEARRARQPRVELTAEHG